MKAKPSRVGAFEAFQPQAAGDLGKFLRELAAHLAKMLQFAFVVGQQARVHE
jgi:hypothetical protein